MSTLDPRLDRLPEFDERSRQFRAVEGIEDKPFRSYTWSVPVSLNQGREGACVGFAWAHEIAARPWPDANITNDYAIAIYRWAQQNDHLPGEDYEGTSVLAGAKAVSEWLDRIREYRWAFGLDDVRRTLGYRGPLVLGLNWYSDMRQTDADGFVHASGEVIGGHAILAYSVSEKGKYVRLWNSWGRGWGQGSSCKVSFDDLGRLLDERGEACIPTRRISAT